MARQTKLPSVPRLTTKDAQLSKFASAIHEMFEVWRGNKHYGDKVVTVNDLVGSGGFSLGTGGGSGGGGGTLTFDGEITYDTTPPAAVTSVATSSGLTSIFITFDALTQTNISHYEIWRNTSNTLDGSELLIGTTIVPMYSDPVGDTLLTYYYWVRGVNTSDIEGPWNATPGTSGATAAVGLTNFASNITPVEIVATLPTTDNFDGRQAFLTTDKKLYRHNGTAWINAVDGADVSTGTLPAAAIVTDSITAGQIAAGAINATELAANAVTAAKIAAGTITADKMNVTYLSAISANLGAITGGSLSINSKFIVDSSGNTTIRSGTTGARLIVQNNVIKVYDSSGVKRVQLGDLTA